MKIRFNKKIIIILMVVIILIIGGIITYKIVTADHEVKIKQGDIQKFDHVLTEYIKQQMLETNTDEISVCLTDQNNILWVRTFKMKKRVTDQTNAQYKDVESSIEVTDDPMPVYGVGSITKIFTAVAILQLYEKGLVDLDTPVIKYIPEFAVKSNFLDKKPITIRSLMTHHSGLPRDIFQGWKMDKEPEDYMDRIGLLKSVPVLYPVDTIFSYSNIGITIIGEIIQKIAGMKYNDYVIQNILDPLEMEHASASYDARVRDLLTGGYYATGDLPAGSMMSNAEDMSHFMQMFLNKGVYHGKQILKKSTVDMMISQQNKHIPFDLDFKIGLNFFLDSFSAKELKDDYLIYWHGGDIPPYHSIMLLADGFNMGIFISTNSDAGSKIIYNIVRKANIYILQCYKGIYLSNKKQKNKPVEYTDKQIEEYKGNYVSPIYGIIVAQKAKDKNNLKFYVPDPLYNSFNLSNYQEYLSISTYDGINYLEFDKNDTKALIAVQFNRVPIDDKWKSYCGFYSIEDQKLNSEDYPLLNLFIKNGYLFLNIGMEHFLKPLDDHDAVMEELGKYANETVTIEEKDGETYLHFSGLVFKKKK